MIKDIINQPLRVYLFRNIFRRIMEYDWGMPKRYSKNFDDYLQVSTLQKRFIRDYLTYVGSTYQ